MDRSLPFDFALLGLFCIVSGFAFTLATSALACNLRTCMPDQNGIDWAKTTSGVREDISEMSDKMGRRDFLGTAAIAGLVAAAGHTLVDSTEAAPMGGDDITSKSASRSEEHTSE